MPVTDVELPGVLPLVLGRFHRSSYRSGRWFGPTWASLLDEHLRVLDDRVLLARADTHVLRFDPPGPLPARATTTPRWTLHAVEAGLVVTDLDTRRRHHFAGDGETCRLTAVTDEAGHRIDIVRDPDGTPREVRHSGGYRVGVHVAQDRVTGYDLLTTDGPIPLIRFGYVAGNLTAVVDSSGLPLRMGYDERGRLTGWTNRVGTWFRHSYDDEDRVVRQRGSGGALSADYVYDTTGPVAGTMTRRDAVGNTWIYAHDEHRRLTAVVDPLGARRSIEYDDEGRPVRETDAAGALVERAYDDAGDLIRVVGPDGAETTIDRDARGLPARVEGPAGTSRFRHDDAGRLLEEIDPAGVRTRYRHDAGRRTWSILDATGAETLVECDAAGLPVAVVDPLGARTTWERDAFGRVVAETDPTGALTRRTWTVEGRPSVVVDPLGGVERREYDGEGNVVALTDPAGGVRRFEYTHFDLLAAETAADGTRTEYAWDAELRLAEVAAPGGLSWTYERDPCGRVVAETDFDGRRTVSERDVLGRVVARTDAAGQRTTYRYSPSGELAERRAPGSLATFDHDDAGRLVRATTADVDVVLRRDLAGRVVSESVNGRELRTAHDALGRPVRRETPSGVVSERSYDAASRVRSLVAGVSVAFDHDAAGRESRRVAGAAAVDLEHDVAGRLVGQRAGGVDRRFGYRADGHLVSLATSTGAREFELDPLGRVTHARGSGDEAPWSEQYAYDALGNTAAASWPGAGASAGPRSVVGTRMQRAGGVTYEHDALGRVVRRTRRRLSHRPDTWLYTWDALDRLVEVRTPDGTRWRYLHDAFGRRVSKQRLDGAGGVAEQVDFTWDGATLVEQVRWAPDGVSSTTWDHSGLRPVTQRERWRRAGQDEVDERFYAVVTDLVGAPTELVGLDGVVAGRARRSLWGRTSWEGSASSPLLFPGQYDDPETGWADNLHRQYDPDTARYASPDPLGLAPAPNPVAYVHNPHTWVDPLGLDPSHGGGGGLVDLSSPEARKHILDGDGPGRGGHYPPAQPGKSEFPGTWSRDQTMHHISDIVTDPSSTIRGGGRGGSIWERTGRPATFRVYGVRDGVPVRVVYQPAGREIITAYPFYGNWN
ncbi:DUF6531 domain-containing protein [Actinomycetospora endophytica]|uniref:DUF6531 domain-containing protein n=2 Tax=Actinomycetospora endophytica TaxID=2291215 RepID=A0ABS8PEA9_9PSEU|nr:DUF6531 domain-containing protein [Actinomycetospora endophytica]